MIIISGYVLGGLIGVVTFGLSKLIGLQPFLGSLPRRVPGLRSRYLPYIRIQRGVVKTHRRARR